MMNNYERVYVVTRMIPKGKVLTYGRLGMLAGIGSPRFVGSALHQNPDGEKTPCHRVVNAAGKCATTFAFGGGESQKEKLKDEGIIFHGKKINLNEFLWRPNISEMTLIENQLLTLSQD